MRQAESQIDDGLDRANLQSGFAGATRARTRAVAVPKYSCEPSRLHAGSAPPPDDTGHLVFTAGYAATYTSNRPDSLDWQAMKRPFGDSCARDADGCVATTGTAVPLAAAIEIPRPPRPPPKMREQHGPAVGRPVVRVLVPGVLHRVGGTRRDRRRAPSLRACRTGTAPDMVAVVAAALGLAVSALAAALWQRRRLIRHHWPRRLGWEPHPRRGR